MIVRTVDAVSNKNDALASSDFIAGSPFLLLIIIALDSLAFAFLLLALANLRCFLGR